MQLRPYQNDLLDRIRAAFRQGSKAPLAVAPTGAGKTVLFAYMAIHATRRGKRVMVIAHRNQLIRQIVEATRAAGHVGVIAGSAPPNYSLPLQVASVSSLIRRLTKIQPVDLLIVDEAHHARAAQYETIIERLNCHVVGFTATPCRSDGKGLGEMFDDLIIGPSISELTSMGYLSPAEIMAPAHIGRDGLKRSKGDYTRASAEAAADKRHITGCAVDYYRKHGRNAPAIAFCATVAHAEHVAQQFRESGYQFSVVHGGMKSAEVHRTLGDLGNGLHGVTSCDLISEGVDVPCAEVGIMLRPTASLGLWIQQVGRMLRTAPGKERALILDHAGNTLHHDWAPGVDVEWSLDEGLVKTSVQGESIRLCKRCFAPFSGPRCGVCGKIPEPTQEEIEQREGELLRIEAEEIQRRRRLEIAQARDIESLQEIEKRRGYKPGWARHVLRARKRKQGGLLC